MVPVSISKSIYVNNFLTVSLSWIILTRMVLPSLCYFLLLYHHTQKEIFSRDFKSVNNGLNGKDGNGYRQVGFTF